MGSEETFWGQNIKMLYSNEFKLEDIGSKNLREGRVYDNLMWIDATSHHTITRGREPTLDQ